MKLRYLGGYFQIVVQPVETKGQLSSKPRSKFDPLDWIDSVDEQSETLQLPRSLYILAKAHTAVRLTFQNLTSNIGQ